MFRRILLASVAVFLALVAWVGADIVRYSADDWAAAAVQKATQPLKLTLINATSADIPVVDFGIAGFFCQSTCVKPGGQRHCTPEFAEASGVFVQFPDKPFPEVGGGPMLQIPVPITWRTHGTIEVIVTDAGFSIDGGFTDALF